LLRETLDFRFRESRMDRQYPTARCQYRKKPGHKLRAVLAFQEHDAVRLHMLTDFDSETRNGVMELPVGQRAGELAACAKTLKRK